MSRVPQREGLVHSEEHSLRPSPSRPQWRAACDPLPKCSSQRTLLNPVNVEQALRKQPRTVRLLKGVIVSEVGHHEASFFTLHREMVRYAVSLSGGSTARQREDGALSNEVHRRIVFVQVREDGSQFLARAQFLGGRRVLRIHIHHEMSVHCKERHLALRVTTVRAMRVSLNQFPDSKSIRGFLG